MTPLLYPPGSKFNQSITISYLDTCRPGARKFVQNTNVGDNILHGKIYIKIHELCKNSYNYKSNDEAQIGFRPVFSDFDFESIYQVQLSQCLVMKKLTKFEAPEASIVNSFAVQVCKQLNEILESAAVDVRLPSHET